ncbi:MAG: hypothetical protein M3O25_00460 [Actinomycetota bacterium]|nr:hypothetical protein [Actinomycetota bacterium]
MDRLLEAADLLQGQELRAEDVLAVPARADSDRGGRRGEQRSEKGLDPATSEDGSQ